MAALTVILVLAHTGTAAAWLGGMLYSLLVVQPKAARFFGTDEETHEAFLATMASGNRWKVLALMAVLAGTGGGLLAIGPTPDPVQMVLHVGEILLLVAAVGVFVHLSWRMWPRRVFALPGERAKLRARFQRAAYGLVALVGTAFVLGVVASALSS